MRESRPQNRSKKRRGARSALATAISMYSAVLLSVETTEAKSPQPFVRVSRSGVSTWHREANVSNESGDPPARVPIHAWQLSLGWDDPEEGPLDAADEKAWHDILEGFLETYVSDQEGSLTFLMLADVQVEEPPAGRRLQDSSTLYVSMGVASFTGDDYPSEEDLAVTISEGIDNDLVGYLANTDYDYITSAEYISLTQSPTASPQVPGGIAMPDQGDDVDDSAKRKGVIAAGSIGACIGVALLAAALLTRRNRGPSLAAHLERDYKDNETHLDSSLHGREREDNSMETSSGGRATRDDSSAWTLSTMPDDANTIVTSFTGKSLITGTSAIHRAESFERDRQVSLRKDMLSTSPGWNMTDNSSENSGKKVDDTVLKPSHFGTDADIAAEITGTTAQAESEAPFRFEANDEGEEIYLMPPAKANKKKQAKVAFT